MTNTVPPKACVSTVVRSVQPETDRIKVYDLMDSEDWELPPFTPGAHIDVYLPGGYVRQYSLCGDPADRHRYRVAVLREPVGRGGSAAFHEHVSKGTVLPVSLPRNRFPLSPDATRHIFIAGGIGITPFMSMIPVLRSEKRDFYLHVCTRRRDDTPFLALLDQLADRGLAEFHHDGGDPSRGLNLTRLLAQPRDGEHVYCCGPVGLMDAVRKATATWAPGRVRFESFSTVAQDHPVQPSAVAYVVELARSGRKIEVAAGETMLTALRRNGIAILSGCEMGNCSTCRVRYLAGEPEHRDFVLSPEERQQFLTSCVSGSRDGKPIVLDL